MDLNAPLQKLGFAVLAAIPFVGETSGLVYVAWDEYQHPRFNPVRNFKFLQAGAGLASSIGMIAGIQMNSAHPKAAVAAVVTGLATQVMAGAAEYLPENAKASFTRAIADTAERFRYVPGKQGFSIGSGRNR